MQSAIVRRNDNGEFFVCKNLAYFYHKLQQYIRRTAELRIAAQLPRPPTQLRRGKRCPKYERFHVACNGIILLFVTVCVHGALKCTVNYRLLLLATRSGRARREKRKPTFYSSPGMFSVLLRRRNFMYFKVVFR